MEKIYHGSEYIIEKPEYKGGKPYNDYGYGFYCTKIPDMAREWSVTRSHDGYVNAYGLDITGLEVVDLNEYGILAWLSVLLKNRTFRPASPLAAEAKEYLLQYFQPDLSQADIIKGYRADDSYFSFARDFINGTISLRQLKEAMYLGEMGQQIVLKSEETFGRIHFLEARRTWREDWLEKRLTRDQNARSSYFSLEKNRRQKSDIYILQILNEEMKPDDARLQ